MTMSHFLSIPGPLTGEARPSAGVDISAIGELRHGSPSTGYAVDGGRACAANSRPIRPSVSLG
jgi:hypothetical protein